MGGATLAAAAAVAVGPEAGVTWASTVDRSPLANAAPSSSSPRLSLPPLSLPRTLPDPCSWPASPAPSPSSGWVPDSSATPAGCAQPVEVPAVLQDRVEDLRRVVTVGLACLVFVGGFAMVQLIPRLRT